MNRYIRQTILPEIGEKGEEKLRSSSVVIVGVGALGSVQAELLGRAGVGKLTLIDFDIVEENNLPRQALYTTADVGSPKVDAAKKHLLEITPDVTVETVMDHLEKRNLNVLDGVDLVMDGTDNMETRFLINEHCYGKTPVIYTSAVMDKGSVLPVLGESVCYHCLYGNKKNAETCCEHGVINGATHLAATMAATEALKYLVGIQNIDGIFSFSLFDGRFEVLKVKQDPECSVCSGKK